MVTAQTVVVMSKIKCSIGDRFIFMFLILIRTFLVHLVDCQKIVSLISRIPDSHKLIVS